MFLKAAEFLGETPDACVVVEDAVVGVEAGVRAGMRVIAIGDAKNTPHRVLKIERVSQIPEILLSIHGQW